MDAAQAKCNLDKSKQGNGRRERAPVKGAKASVKPTKPADLDRKRGRAPAKGVTNSLSDSIRGGGNKGALGSGQERREQAPASEAKDSDDPSTSLDEDAIDASETSAGKRERAPAEGLVDSDIPAQSIDKKTGLAIFTWPS